MTIFHKVVTFRPIETIKTGKKCDKGAKTAISSGKTRNGERTTNSTNRTNKIVRGSSLGIIGGQYKLLLVMDKNCKWRPVKITNGESRRDLNANQKVP